MNLPDELMNAPKWIHWSLFKLHGDWHGSVFDSEYRLHLGKPRSWMYGECSHVVEKMVERIKEMIAARERMESTSGKYWTGFVGGENG